MLKLEDYQRADVVLILEHAAEDKASKLPHGLIDAGESLLGKRERQDHFVQAKVIDHVVVGGKVKGIIVEIESGERKTITSPDDIKVDFSQNPVLQ